MDGNGSAKANQRNRRKEAAARLSYLRNGKFVTAGFGHHENPSVERARELAAYNARLIASQRPTPSVSA